MPPRKLRILPLTLRAVADQHSPWILGCIDRAAVAVYTRQAWLGA